MCMAMYHADKNTAIIGVRLLWCHRTLKECYRGKHYYIVNNSNQSTCKN